MRIKINLEELQKRGFQQKVNPAVVLYREIAKEMHADPITVCAAFEHNTLDRVKPIPNWEQFQRC